MFFFFKQKTAYEIVQSAVPDRGRGPSAAMVCLRRGEIHAPPPKRLRADCQVEILVIDEEPFIETAQGLKQRTANEAKRAHHLIDGACFLMVPLEEKMRREDRRHEPIEGENVADHGQGTRPPGAGARDLAVGVDELDADDAGRFIDTIVQEPRRRLETSRRKARVGIEKQKEIRGRSGGTLVGRRGKSPVFPIADDRERQGSFEPRSRIKRSVDGGVVDHRNAREGCRIVNDGSKRLQALDKLISRVPIDDNDVNRRAQHRDCSLGQETSYISYFPPQQHGTGSRGREKSE